MAERYRVSEVLISAYNATSMPIAIRNINSHSLCTVEEIARIVVRLAGEDSSWITGQVLSASGGLEMY